jgi:hypothetical protein
MTLRKLIQSLVPKTNKQVLSDYLNFPPMPEFVDNKIELVEESTQSESWTMENFASISSTTNNHTPIPEINLEVETEQDESQWLLKSISKFKLDPSPKAIELADEVPPVPTPEPAPTPEPQKNINILNQLDEKKIEELVTAQAQQIIEKVVWQVVPEIATRIIERELQRLLSEQKSP